MNNLQENEINSLGKRLGDKVDRESPSIRKGRAESHDIQSLAKRLAAPEEAVKGFLAAGILKPEGPVSKGAGPTRHVFASDDLNSLRRQVLAHIVGKVIDEDTSDDADSIDTAASHALREHLAQNEKADDKKREFSRRISTGGAVMLGTYIRDDQDERDDNGILKTAAAAATIAGAGAAGLGVAGHLGLQNIANNLAASKGMGAADSFLLKNRGLGTRIKAGWALTRGGATGAASGALSGARSGVADVLDRLRNGS